MGVDYDMGELAIPDIYLNNGVRMPVLGLGKIYFIYVQLLQSHVAVYLYQQV